jgi:hypothetical protein
VSKKALDLGHGGRFTLVGAFGWVNASRNNAELDPALSRACSTEPAQDDAAAATFAVSILKIA